jgi:uncharacterized protein (DUF1778 family)
MTNHMTTVKVRKETRELISHAARGEGSTIDEYLTRIITEHIWRERMDLARRMMQEPDADYLRTTEAWDMTSSDGVR